jgi:hypothetical protein
MYLRPDMAGGIQAADIVASAGDTALKFSPSCWVSVRTVGK